jgi:hypothetical protein
VELLPIFEFDDSDVALNPAGAPIGNFWGYSTIAFFSPHSGYCVRHDGLSHLNEFRDLVKALHKAGIEVILDVVFNHTDEGNEFGPTHSPTVRPTFPNATNVYSAAAIDGWYTRALSLFSPAHHDCFSGRTPVHIGTAAGDGSTHNHERRHLFQSPPWVWTFAQAGEAVVPT